MRRWGFVTAIRQYGYAQDPSRISGCAGKPLFRTDIPLLAAGLFIHRGLTVAAATRLSQ